MSTGKTTNKQETRHVTLLRQPYSSWCTAEK